MHEKTIFSIREGTTADFEAVFEMSCEAVAQGIYPQATPSRQKMWDCYTALGVLSFIARKNEDVIGFIWLEVGPFFYSDAIRATDLGLYIKSEHRGGSTAKRLLKAAENALVALGVKVFYVGQSLGIEVEKTKNFYLRAGFKTAGFNTMKRI